MHSFRVGRILTIAFLCVAPLVSAQPSAQHSAQQSTQTISVVLGPVDAPSAFGGIRQDRHIHPINHYFNKSITSPG